jgi:hypothetical protein
MAGFAVAVAFPLVERFSGLGLGLRGPANPGVAGFAASEPVITSMAVDKSEGVVKDKNVLSGVGDTACSPEKVEDQDSGISR